MKETCKLTPRNGQPCGKPAGWLVTHRDPYRAADLSEHRCEVHRRIGFVVGEKKL